MSNKESSSFFRRLFCLGGQEEPDDNDMVDWATTRSHHQVR